MPKENIIAPKTEEVRKIDLAQKGHGVLTSRILMSGMMENHYKLTEPEHNQKKEIEYFDFEKHKKQLDEKVSQFKKQQLSKDVNNIVEKIIEIMTKKYYRRGSRANFEVARKDYEKQFSKAVFKKEKLQLILPSFPVKCWNPIKVERRMPDLAEIQCLSRLYLLCKEMEKVYEPGAKVVLIADGAVYAPIFNEPPNIAIQYKNEVISLCKKTRNARIYNHGWYDELGC